MLQKHQPVYKVNNLNLVSHCRRLAPCQLRHKPRQINVGQLTNFSLKPIKHAIKLQSFITILYFRSFSRSTTKALSPAVNFAINGVAREFVKSQVDKRQGALVAFY